MPEPQFKPLTQASIEALAKSRYKDFPAEELELFRLTCNRVELDPFAGQIMLDRRWNARENGWIYSPYTQIDGFRVIAERTDDYSGQRGPEWYDADPDNARGYESEEDRWWGVWPFYLGEAKTKRHPYAARVSILRKGFDEPLVSVVRWSAYAQFTGKGDKRRLNAIWAQRGDFQLAKCAEALGLRRACPNLLSGLHTEEEIEVIRSAEEEVEANVAEDEDFFGSDISDEESTKARDGWLLNVANAKPEDLDEMQADFTDGFSKTMQPIHQAEVLAAIAERRSASEEPVE